MGNSDGVAWVFAMIGIALIVLALLWAVTTPMLNIIVVQANDRIEAGQLSGQTADVIGFNLMIYQNFPVFVLGAMILLAIVVALYKRREDFT